MTELQKIQDEEKQKLNAEISQKQADVNAKLEKVEGMRKTNLFENEKNKNYVKASAALRAKLDFIEAKYDYSSTAKQMSINDFKELIESNNSINNVVSQFTVKLDTVQKEIQTLETMKQMMAWW